MTQPPQPTEQFAQHPRLAELVTALGFRRYRLFLTGLLYQEPDGPPRRASAVASRDGDLVADDAGEVVEHAGRVPTVRRRPHRAVLNGPGGRLGRAQPGLLRARGGRMDRGRRSINEVGIELLHHWFLPEPPRSPSPIPRCSGWSRSRSPKPCWTSSAAWPTTTSAGFMVEHVMELLATS